MNHLQFHPHGLPTPVRLMMDNPRYSFPTKDRGTGTCHLKIFRTEPLGHVLVVHHGTGLDGFLFGERPRLFSHLAARWAFPLTLIEHDPADNDVPERWRITAYDHIGHLETPIPVEALGGWWNDHRELLGAHGLRCPQRAATGLAEGTGATTGPFMPLADLIASGTQAVMQAITVGPADRVRAAAADWLQYVAERLMEPDADTDCLFDCAGIERFRIGHGLPGSAFLPIYSTAWFAIGRIAYAYFTQNATPVQAGHLAAVQNKEKTVFLLIQAAHQLRKPATT